MIRTQIQLTVEQAERLKELARARNKSIAGMIREALDQFLGNQEPGGRTLYRQALKVVGKYKSGVNDISIDHDKYLEEEFGS
jgi:predicted DNA-binding protein